VGHTGSISQVRASSSSDIVVSASYDRTVRLWGVAPASNAATRRAGPKEICVLKGHKAPVLEVAWGDGGELISGARDGVVLLWDLVAGRAKAARSPEDGGGHITAMEHFEWGGAPLLAFGSQDGKVRVWDLRIEAKAGSIVCCTAPHDKGKGGQGAVGGIAYSSTHGYLVTYGADANLCVLDPRASFGVVHRLQEHKDFIYSMRLAGDKILSGAGDGSLIVNSLRTGECLYGLGANQAAVRCIDVSSDGGVLLAAGDDGNAIVWDMKH